MGIKDKMMGVFLKNMLAKMNENQKKELVRQAIFKMMPNSSEKEREALIEKSMPMILELMSDPNKMMEAFEEMKKDGKIPPEMKNIL